MSSGEKGRVVPDPFLAGQDARSRADVVVPGQKRGTGRMSSVK